MSTVRTVEVVRDEAELRLDRWFARHFPHLGHGPLEKLLRTGQVRVDGRRAKAGLRLVPGQRVRVPPLDEPAEPSPVRRAAAASAEDVGLIAARLLFEDDHMIVIDKPAGLAVQGGSGQRRHIDALARALVADDAEPPKLVHRLDKDTSGVLVLARTPAAARSLARAFRLGRARKSYWAVVVGAPRPRAGEIDLALDKRAGRRGERVVTDRKAGRRALTRYRTIDQAGGEAAWLALSPQTGRTHQLRVHCAEIGTPILGDGKYGGKGAFLGGLPAARRLHLHARALALPHPDGYELCLTAPLPVHMRATFDQLGFDPASPVVGEEP